MNKKKLKWLEDFVFIFNASDSFIIQMDKQLNVEFQIIYGKEIDFKYLCAYPDQELTYSFEENVSRINCFISNDGAYVIGKATVSWLSNIESKNVLPSENVVEGDITFKWENISLKEPKLSEIATFDIKLFLGISTYFPINFEESSFSSDFILTILLVDLNEKEKLDKVLDNEIQKWQKSNPERLIFDYGEHEAEGVELSLFLNTGHSDPRPILKAIFQIIEDSGIKVKEVTLENI